MVALILKEALQERRARNSAYSLRSFARDIGVSPSFASMLINGRKRLSLDKAFHISKAMRMNEEERIEFLRAVAESSCPDLELMQDLRKVFTHGESVENSEGTLLQAHRRPLRELKSEVLVESTSQGPSIEGRDQFRISINTNESKRNELINLVNEFRNKIKSLEQVSN